MRKHKSIPICKYCNLPLVFTFNWKGYEYFCLNCGEKFAFMEEKEVSKNEELEAASRVIKRVWKALSFYLLPDTKDFFKTNCKKCKDESHYKHLSRKEKLCNKYAVMILEKLNEGFYDKEEYK